MSHTNVPDGFTILRRKHGGRTGALSASIYANYSIALPDGFREVVPPTTYSKILFARSHEEKPLLYIGPAAPDIYDSYMNAPVVAAAAVQELIRSLGFQPRTHYQLTPFENGFTLDPDNKV